MNSYLFSYGTLQNEAVQLKIFGHRLRGTEDQLKNYTIATVEIKDKNFLLSGNDRFQKTIIPTGNEADTVDGMALELTEEDLRLADQYEPGNYERTLVELASGKQAWVYISS